jgi:hypothetical protein
VSWWKVSISGLSATLLALAGAATLVLFVLEILYRWVLI